MLIRDGFLLYLLRLISNIFFVKFWIIKRLGLCSKSFFLFIFVVMEECINFSKTLTVGRRGDKIWLGTATYSSGMMILVTYYLNGDEVSDFFEPIVDGDNIYLDLNTPSKDYYNPYQSYYVSLTDTSGYFSDGINITNGGETHEGFIINFSVAENDRDRLVVV